MKILFLGDVVATPGREAIKSQLLALRAELGVDCVIVNGENAAAGRGITPEIGAELLAAGVDVLTLGDHTFDQRGVESLLAGNPRVIRPANYAKGTVGRGSTIFVTASGKRVAVVNMMGRVFMRPLTDCPFVTSKALMEELRLGDTVDAIVVDMHAEATSEKAAMAHWWDGKASLVVGTHTHIPTHDARIQPGGTAMLTDAGMCGDYNSSLGMTLASVMPGFVAAAGHKFTPAEGVASLCGVLVEVGENGLATRVESLRRGPITG
jgi:2',3'-cyclic-nucleotide 2'-phosphodiesterase